MDKRKIWAIIIIVVGAVLLAGIIYLLFFKSFGAKVAPSTKLETVVNTETKEPKFRETDLDARKVELPPTKRTTEQVSQDALKRQALLFAERLGSFSTHSTYQNMIDLQLFMTKRMIDWSDKYVAENVAKSSANKDYYGITTKGVTTAMTKYDEAAGQAIVKVGTYRTESTSQTDSAKSFSQDLLVTYKKEGSTWKVDEARWVEIKK